MRVRRRAHPSTGPPTEVVVAEYGVRAEHTSGGTGDPEGEPGRIARQRLINAQTLLDNVGAIAEARGGIERLRAPAQQRRHLAFRLAR